MRISKHIAIGMEACGSKIIRIIKPTDTSAYQMKWYGPYRFENPKWYEIDLGGWLIRNFLMDKEGEDWDNKKEKAKA